MKGWTPPRVSLRAAAIAWTLVAVAVSGKIILSPRSHTHWPAFQQGGLGWWEGKNIYAGSDPSVPYFSYSPAFAVLLAPLAAMPGPLGNLVFDLGGLAILFHAIRRLTRVVFPEPVLSRDEAAVLLLSIAGVLRSVWSSQSHIWSAALVFLAAAALVERRYWASALALALAVHLKVAPLAIVGVVALNWPRAMMGRLVAAIAAWGALPALRGGPARAVEMYGQWMVRLQLIGARRWPSFRDAMHVFEVAGVAVPTTAYRAVQVAGGLAVLAWVWRLRRRGPGDVWLVSGIFALTICYMLVLGPAVEFVQYPLLAPWVSAAWLAAGERPRGQLLFGLVYLVTMITAFGAVEDSLSVPFHSTAPEALITLGTLAFGAWVAWRWQHGPEVAPVAAAPK